MTRRIMRTFKIHEISGVDRPAQAGARMTILKRDDPGMKPTTVMKGIENMTEAEVAKMVADAVTAATADLSKKLTGAEATIAKAWPPKKKSADGAAEPDADDATKAAWRPYVTKMVSDAVAKAKEEFETELAKRDDIVKNDETFTTDGVTIRKSEVGEPTFKVMKSQQERIEIADFSKRAELEIPHLPGDTTLKAKALRAVSGLSKDVGDALTAMLKAGSAAMKAGMNQIGNSAPAETSAAGQLEKLAKAHAVDHKVTYAEAYGKVLETREGGELYATLRAERRAN